MKQSVRGTPVDDMGDLGDDGHSPEGEADPAGARRLLADRPGLDRDGLVDQAAGDATDADRAIDDVGSIDRVLESSRRAVPNGCSLGFSHPGQDGLDASQPARIDVVEHDLVVPGPGLAARDRPVDDRCAESTPAQDRKLHRERLRVRHGAAGACPPASCQAPIATSKKSVPNATSKPISRATLAMTGSANFRDTDIISLNT